MLSGAPDIVVQKLVAGRHDLIPSYYADAIREIRGVTSVRPALWGYYFDPVFGANYTVMVPEDVRRTAGARVAIGPGVAKATGSEIDYILPFWTSKGKLTSFFVKELLVDASRSSCRPT